VLVSFLHTYCARCIIFLSHSLFHLLHFFIFQNFITCNLLFSLLSFASQPENMYKTLGRLSVEEVFFFPSSLHRRWYLQLFQLLINTCHYVLAKSAFSQILSSQSNILRLSSLRSTFLALEKNNSEAVLFRDVGFFEGLNGTPFSYRLSYSIERPIRDHYPLENID